MTIFGKQRDWKTDNWFFLVYGPEGQNGELIFQSKPLYETEEDAEAAAMEWIRKNVR